MTTCLRKSCSFGLPCVSFMNVYQFVCAFFPFSVGLNSILLINRHIQQDNDIYGTGSDRKLKACINHLLSLYKSSPFSVEGRWDGGIDCISS